MRKSNHISPRQSSNIKSYYGEREGYICHYMSSQTKPGTAWKSQEKYEIKGNPWNPWKTWEIPGYFSSVR